MSLNLDKSDWKRVTLGDVATASKEQCDPNEGSVVRYVAGEHMDSNDLKIHRWGQVGDGYLGPAFHRRFHPGQVLYGSRRTYLRKVAVADFNGVCANTTFVVETKSTDALLQNFLPFIMTSEQFHAFAIAESKGSVNPYVNWSDIARYEFDLPPLDEQKRIADLLWSIEVDATSTGNLRKRTEDARSVWLADRVTDLVSAETLPFEQVWSRSPESGWSAAPVDEVTGRLVLSLAALGPDGYRAGQYKNVPDTTEVRKTTLTRGDLLVSRANTLDAVGRVGIFSEERSDVSFPDTMMRIHVKPGIASEFVEMILSSAHGRRHMRRTAAGSATSMVKINRASLGRLEFPKTSIDTQRAMLRQLWVFNTALRACDAQISATRLIGRSALAEVFGGAA